MQIELPNFRPTTKQARTSVECLPLCLEAMLEYNGHAKQLKSLRKQFVVDQYGYDLLAVLAVLAEHNLVTAVGLFDKDYLGQTVSSRLSLGQLKTLTKKRASAPSHEQKGLAGIISFVSKYPTIIKVQPTSIEDIARWLSHGQPVGLTLGIAEFAEIDDESIHCVAVYGLEGNAVSIWDPVNGFLEGPVEHLVEAWQAVGGYYFALK